MRSATPSTIAPTRSIIGNLKTNIVVVSEPLDSDHHNWIAVPENHMLIAKAGERVLVVPMFQRHQEAAE